jgi:hypothetical protein
MRASQRPRIRDSRTRRINDTDHETMPEGFHLLRFQFANLISHAQVIVSVRSEDPEISSGVWSHATRRCICNKRVFALDNGASATNIMLRVGLGSFHT